MPKINELPRASALTGTDLLAMDNSSGTATKSVSGDQIKDYVTADVAADVADLKNAITAINGNHEIAIAQNEGSVSVNGATAVYDSGKVKVYGSISGSRFITLFNNPWGVCITSTAFTKTLDPGTYKVKFKLTGNQPTYDSPSFPAVSVTASTFANASYYFDGDVFTTDVPVMVGLLLPGWKNYGTSEDPSYFEVGLTKYSEKLNKNDFMLTPSGARGNVDGENITAWTNAHGGYCKLSPGTFYIDVLAFPGGANAVPVTIEGCGNSTELVITTASSYSYGIRISNGCAIKNLAIKYENPSYTPAPFPSFGLKHGIRIAPATGQGKTNCTIENVSIENFDGAGILVHATGQDTQDGSHVTSCFVHNCGAGIWFTTNAEYNRVDCCDFSQNYYGAVCDGGNNVFTNCNFSGNIYGFYMDNSSGNLTNNTHGSVIGCTFNHEDYDSTTLGKGYSIYMIGATSGMTFVGCQVFYGKIYLKNCMAIALNDFNFGKMTTVNSEDTGIVIDIVHDNSTTYTCFMNNCVFAIAPTINIDTSDVKMKFLINNCYTRYAVPVTL